MKEKLALDIGCGNNPTAIEGYRTVGTDLKLATRADVVCDVENPLPFGSNTFDMILCFDVLEHIHHIISLLEEIYRVGKPGALVKVRVPHFSSMDLHQDLTHVRGFGTRVFYPFTGKKEEVSHYAHCRFKQLKTKITFWPITELGNIRLQNWFGIGLLANTLTSFYERFLCYIFPAQAVYFELEIDKN